MYALADSTSTLKWLFIKYVFLFITFYARASFHSQTTFFNHTIFVFALQNFTARHRDEERHKCFYRV